MKKTLLYLIVLCTAMTIMAERSTAQLQTYEFSKLDSLQAQEPKSVFVFIHTDWCKFCHQMENTTFKNDSIVQILNEHFYFVKFNAELTEVVVYGGDTFRFKPTGSGTGLHELAWELGQVNSGLSYPTVSIVSAQNRFEFRYGGALKSDVMLAVLKAVMNEWEYGQPGSMDSRE